MGKICEPRCAPEHVTSSTPAAEFEELNFKDVFCTVQLRPDFEHPSDFTPLNDLTNRCHPPLWVGRQCAQWLFDKHGQRKVYGSLMAFYAPTQELRRGVQGVWVVWTVRLLLVQLAMRGHALGAVSKLQLGECNVGANYLVEIIGRRKVTCRNVTLHLLVKVSVVGQALTMRLGTASPF